MKLKKVIKKNKEFFLILVIAIAARAVLLFAGSSIWWDSGVYAGMGKFIFSFGESGLWEPIRPVVLPVFLGLIWKAKLDVLLFGRLLELFFSAGSITLLYLSSKRLFGRQVALVSSAIFSFSAVFFLMGFHLYTEVPCVFFVLAAVYSYINEKHALSGVFAAAAFLTKFPAGIFLIPFLVILAYSRNLRNAAKFCAGFAIPAFAFLAANHFAYGNFLFPFTEASSVISNVLGCNYLRYKPWHWYFSFLAVSENFLHIFSFLGAYYSVKKYNPARSALLMFIIIPFAYFAQLHCRDFRYLVLAVPFISVLSAIGICKIIKKKGHFIPALAVIFVISAGLGVAFYRENNVLPSDAESGYMHFLEGREIRGEVWSSSPLPALYSDARLRLVYYPVYNSSTSKSFYIYLIENKANISYALMDSCGGGIMCHPEDAECAKNLLYSYSFLSKNFNVEYNQKQGACRYLAYSG